MKLRPATHSDISQIAGLWHRSWHDAHADVTPKALTDQRTLTSFLIRTQKHIADFQVASTDSEVLGIVMIKDDELSQIYVTAAARGTGTAAKLVNWAEEQIKLAGHKKIWLACAIGNHRAARFYEKSGFKNTATITYELETLENPFQIEVWRFEKTI